MVVLSGCAGQAHAFTVFNLNVFDQLQGKWDENFRARRMGAVAHYVNALQPDLVTFQEARAVDAGSLDSEDSLLMRALFPYRLYIHEMRGADDASYGYFMGAKVKPRDWIADGFFFEGGVERRVQAAVFEKALGEDCLGVVSLHLSYQNSKVRQTEAAWLLNWLKEHEQDCRQWLVVGDFNADEKSEEMNILFNGGLKSLYKELKPSVGAFNPIRRIYGENIPSLTIDWALGWNINGSAEMVLDTPYQGEWVSDHAGVLIQVDSAAK